MILLPKKLLAMCSSHTLISQVDPQPAILAFVVRVMCAPLRCDTSLMRFAIQISSCDLTHRECGASQMMTNVS